MSEKLESIIREAFKIGIEYFPPKTAPNGSLFRYTQDKGPSDPEVIQFIQAIFSGEQPAPPTPIPDTDAREIEAFFESHKKAG